MFPSAIRPYSIGYSPNTMALCNKRTAAHSTMKFGMNAIPVPPEIMDYATKEGFVDALLKLEETMRGLRLNNRDAHIEHKLATHREGILQAINIYNFPDEGLTRLDFHLRPEDNKPPYLSRRGMYKTNGTKDFEFPNPLTNLDRRPVAPVWSPGTPEISLAALGDVLHKEVPDKYGRIVLPTLKNPQGKLFIHVRGSEPYEIPINRDDIHAQRTQVFSPNTLNSIQGKPHYYDISALPTGIISPQSVLKAAEHSPGKYYVQVTRDAHQNAQNFMQALREVIKEQRRIAPNTTAFKLKIGRDPEFADLIINDGSVSRELGEIQVQLHPGKSPTLTFYPAGPVEQKSLFWFSPNIDNPANGNAYPFSLDDLMYLSSNPQPF